MSAPDETCPLRVALRAADPARHEWLALVIASGGHVLAGEDGQAAVVLTDLEAGETIWDEAAACVVLSDTPSLAREAGLRAVLPRAATTRQIDAALRAAAAGLFVRVDEAAATGFGQVDEKAPDESLPLLTPRELEILTAVGAGMSNKAVARQLGISAHTVKFHLEAVFGKLDANTRAEAVAKGLRRGLIEV